MTNFPTPKAAQEHRCVKFYRLANGEWYAQCSCELWAARRGNAVKSVMAFYDHAAYEAASRGEAPKDDRPLTQVVAELRAIPGNEWGDLENPWEELKRIQCGEAPAFSEAQRERAALAARDAWRNVPWGPARDQTFAIVVDAILAALKETP